MRGFVDIGAVLFVLLGAGFAQWYLNSEKAKDTVPVHVDEGQGTSQASEVYDDDLNSQPSVPHPPIKQVGGESQLPKGGLEKVEEDMIENISDELDEFEPITPPKRKRRMDWEAKINRGH